MLVKLRSFSTKNSVLSAYSKFVILLLFTSTIARAFDVQKCLNRATTAAQSGRNRKQLDNYLAGAQEIHLKKEQQIVGCIPGMIGVLLPVHKHSFTEDESYSFLNCGTKMNSDGMQFLEDFHALLNKWMW